MKQQNEAKPALKEQPGEAIQALEATKLQIEAEKPQVPEPTDSLEQIEKSMEPRGIVQMLSSKLLSQILSAGDLFNSGQVDPSLIPIRKMYESILQK